MGIIKKVNSKITLLKMRFFHKEHYDLINRVINNKLTYLDKAALSELYLTFKSACENGIFIEAGCALGGSALTIAFSKSKSRPLYIYDVFDVIPPPSISDGNDVLGRYEVIKEGKSEGINGDIYVFGKLKSYQCGS